MKSQSNVMQDRIWIRYIDDQDYCVFRLRDNFQELQKEGFDGQTEIYYEYDEVELKLLNRDNIEQFIEDNFNDLFQFGLEQEIKQKEEQEKQRKLDELVKQGKIIEENERLKQENEQLKNENIKLNNDLNVAMLAVADLYEQILNGGV